MGKEIMFKIRLAKKSEIPILTKWSKCKANKHVNFSMCIAEPDTKKLIVSFRGKPIGVVVIDVYDGEVSIFLVPGNHGKGNGGYCLYMAHGWIRRYYPDIGHLWADCGTLASIRLFREMGYEQDITGDWNFYF